MTVQVLSMQPAHVLDFGSSGDQFPSSASNMSAQQTQAHPAGPTPNNPDDQRGRRRVRENEDDDEDMELGGAEGQGGSSKKRRRSRKGMDKKFECPQEGCGKSYSRAEHLYRHQLNHNPKQIYRCDFPDCQRSFVRQDLCARHKERHTARGSQLLRKDNFMQNPNPIVTAALRNQNDLRQGQSPGIRSNNPFQTPQTPHDTKFNVHSPMSGISNSTGRSDQSPPLDPAIQSPGSDTPHGGSLNRAASDFYNRNDGRPQQDYLARQQSYGTGNEPYPRPGNVAQNMQSLSLGSSPYVSNNPSYHNPGQSNSGYPNSNPAANYQPHQNFPPLPVLPPPQHHTMGFTSHPVESDYSSSTGPMQMESQAQAMTQATEAQILETMTPQFAMPMFGGEGISRSPFAMADDFTAWLFNEQNSGSSANASPMAYNTMMGNTMAAQGLGLNSPYVNYDPSSSGPLNQPLPPQHPMAVNSILDSTLPESQLSEERRLQLIDLIEMRFNDVSHLHDIKKQDIIDGARSEGHHLLSPNMMQTYVSSYWLHFHAQMPILHRPTFSANHCSELLLIAVMAIGASCLERTHGFSTTQQCSELANFLSCNLRWEVFMDADFRPPAKLWVFQALILLECYEKMYATRPLHERAHIHHATTLTLMRRGSSLIGRSSVDSPPSVRGERHGSMNGAVNSGATTPDDWWNQWVTQEATRRAAFAAFVMDSLHATMFGHSAVMVAHEMRLALPCDEALWAATSSADVGRAEQLNHSKGIKPTLFLDGLKKTLNNQPIRTNAFGRTIIMAGLLSVSWHMNQRDLQVSSLGVTSALGGRDKSRGALTRAFDFWKVNFDENTKQTAKEQRGQSSSRSHPDLDHENIFEGRTVLHHLAHMAMHVDIVDCQIFAGARRLLGRTITSQDSAGAQRRMKEVWAPTARARDATFYALRFLSQVLLPEEHDGRKTYVGYAMEDNPLARYDFTYSARDDFLLHRPWVLYFATLIVFSYGYALDGPLQPVYTLNSDEDRVRDMQLFLQRVGGVQSPEDLMRMQHRNACLGLLVLLKDMFMRTRWELMHEASSRLSDCIDMLTGIEKHKDSGQGSAIGERLMTGH